MAVRSAGPSRLLTRPRKISCPARCVGDSFAQSSSAQLGGVVATGVGVGDDLATSELVPQAVQATRTMRASARGGMEIERPRHLRVTLTFQQLIEYPDPHVSGSRGL